MDTRNKRFNYCAEFQEISSRGFAKSVSPNNCFRKTESAFLRILNKNNSVTLNENKYGIHINLSEVKSEILEELNTYIKYVNAQEITLNAIEQKKEDYKNTYFSKDIKDNNKIINSK